MKKLEHRYETLGEKGLGKDYFQVSKYQIVYKDIFNLKYLYMLMHEWLVENNYCTRIEQDFGEVFYLQRNKPSGKDYLIRWRVGQEYPLGSTIFRYQLDIDILVLLLNKVELIRDGKKINAEKGEITIDVRANLLTRKDSILGKIKGVTRDIVFNTLYRSNFETHKAKLNGDAYKFRDAINQYLQIQTKSSLAQMGDFYEKAKPE